MKKVRILIVAICVSLMVMGIGYSVWSQTITVNIGGTLGTFEVNTIGAYVMTDRGLQVPNNDITSADIDDGGKTVSLTTNKLIPGDYREFKIVFKNVGDCPAELKKVDFSRESGDNVLDYIRISVNSGAWVKLNDASIGMAMSLASGDSGSISVKVKLDIDAQNSSIAKPFKLTMTPYFAQP